MNMNKRLQAYIKVIVAALGTNPVEFGRVHATFDAPVQNTQVAQRLQRHGFVGCLLMQRTLIFVGLVVIPGKHHSWRKGERLSQEFRKPYPWRTQLYKG